MLDTVAVSAPIETVPKVEGLERRGWTVHTTRTPRQDRRVEELRKATLTMADGARLAYFEAVGWLRAEASLPKRRYGANDMLLEWSECEQELQRLADDAAAMMGEWLPGLDRWRVCRIDPVWAWPCDPGPYMSALPLARLRGSQLVQEGSSMRWRSQRSGRILGRVYDKAAEAGHRVDLPTRFEMQTRPNRQVVKVNGQRLSRIVSDLDAAAVFSILSGGLQSLGLDKPLRSARAARSLLVSHFGPRKGDTLYSHLLRLRAEGWPTCWTTGKRRRIERDLAAAGVGWLAEDDCELPGLTVPGGECLLVTHDIRVQV